jgi:protein-tyrosine phosphatase/Fe-S-cluster containining protein
MSAYRLHWITEYLAVGHAPMSYDELDSIRSQGINGIVNLCGEFCDLHKIESDQGFEVYYLPTCDDEAPTIPDLEKALDWLDEAIYLGKKVLVHCRQGIGRTGTFVTAYLLRKGFGMKLARKKVEKTRAGFTSFPQWRLLKKYKKNSGELTFRVPSLETKRTVDLKPFFQDYEILLEQVDAAFKKAAARDSSLLSCGLDTEACCFRLVDLQLVEAAYLSHKMNKTLKTAERKAAIERAIEVTKRVRELRRRLEREDWQGDSSKETLHLLYEQEKIKCPLNLEAKCILYGARPIACRMHGLAIETGVKPEISGDFAKKSKLFEPEADLAKVDQSLQRLSINVLHALTSILPNDNGPTFTLPSAVTGRFVQEYFHWIATASF